LIKFANICYDEFGVNITKHKTYSGLSFYIYLSNFYNIDYNITMIKGGVESEIRKSYFGGSIILTKNIIDRAYFYDINSQYPYQMLKPMPVGNPILSTDTNLDNYFGFCYVEVIPPKYLKNYLIPFRNINGNIIYPDTPFSGIYFSEFLKESLKYGYKFNVKGGFKFEKGIGIFDKFVNNLYTKRLQANENGYQALEKVLKIILNSLSGRMGMKEIENKTEIVDIETAELIMKNKIF
jgi:hypothetical protein